MSTKLTEGGTFFTVETVASFGGKRKMARGAVRVPKGDLAAVRKEIEKQATALRKLKQVDVPPKEPVV